MQRGLWLVAVVFAGLLIGLGATVVGDLPRVEKERSVEDYLDVAASRVARSAAKNFALAGELADRASEQAPLKLVAAQADSAAVRESSASWLATRRQTQRSDQDPELVKRTQALNALKDKERSAGVALEAQRQAALDARQGAGPEKCRH